MCGKFRSGWSVLNTWQEYGEIMRHVEPMKPSAEPAFRIRKRPMRYRRSRIELRIPVVLSMTPNVSCVFPNPTGFLAHCSDN